MNEICNIGLQLREMAKRTPDKRAVVFPQSRTRSGLVSYTHLTFSQLEALSDSYAHGFRSAGISRGVRTLVMLKPGLDFFAVIFALFKTGAVPVLIDPGMGVRRLLHCIKSAAPHAMIGIPLAHAVRKLQPWYFKSVKHNVTAGARLFWGGHTLAELKSTGMPFAIEDTTSEELAAILFTTGSTGPAKGVEYEHGMFAAQCELIASTYGIGSEDIDLPTFPLFALFSVGLGMTAVVPDMDPTRPAEVNPQRIVEAIRNQGCTFSFGSPALWGRVSKYCVNNSIRLPSLRKILMAGAPVPPQTHRNLLEHILPDGAKTHTPYGATESLPACDITGNEVLQETAALTESGKGYCVGKPVNTVEVKIIKLTDDAIAQWDDSLVLPQGSIGEITVKGRNVTKCYHNLPEHTRMAKIKDGADIRHRIGDLGYFDEQGRLWFCGRKAHRVECEGKIMYSVCCEAIFNNHPQIKRSALVGIGERPRQKPVIMVEPLSDTISKRQRQQIRAELLQMAKDNPLTADITEIIFHSPFPVDIRHNAKINRELLSQIAQKKLIHTVK